MLNGMHSQIIHIVATVRYSGTKVVGCNVAVNSGDVYPLNQQVVVYGKGGNLVNFLHILILRNFKILIYDSSKLFILTTKICFFDFSLIIKGLPSSRKQPFRLKIETGIKFKIKNRVSL